jgi:hypothetical protein
VKLPPSSERGEGFEPSAALSIRADVMASKKRVRMKAAKRSKALRREEAEVIPIFIP